MRYISKLLVFFLMAGMLFALVGCGGSQTDTGLGSPEPPVKAPTATEIERTDADGLVTVWVKGDEATIGFDVGRWEELYALSESFDSENIELLQDVMTYPIRYLSGKIIDVCIGTAEGFGQFAGGAEVTPTVLFLMDDGSVQYLEADFFNPLMQLADFGAKGIAELEFETVPVPYLTDIVSLSFEEYTGESSGSYTIYATDVDGLRYDARIPMALSMLSSLTWDTEVYLDDAGGDYSMYGFLEFSEDRTVTWNIGHRDASDYYEMYQGTYEFVLAEDLEYPAGSIILDLNLGWYIYDGDDINATDFAHSVYYTDATGFSAYVMGLNLIDGDPLPSVDSEYSFDLYEFNSNLNFVDDLTDGKYHGFQTEEEVNEIKN